MVGADETSQHDASEGYRSKFGCHKAHAMHYAASTRVIVPRTPSDGTAAGVGYADIARRSTRLIESGHDRTAKS
jgi:hypothetical protein